MSPMVIGCADSRSIAALSAKSPFARTGYATNGSLALIVNEGVFTKYARYCESVDSHTMNADADTRNISSDSARGARVVRSTTRSQQRAPSVGAPHRATAYPSRTR